MIISARWVAQMVGGILPQLLDLPCLFISEINQAVPGPELVLHT